MTPSYGGLYLFGDACKVRHTPNATANQIAAFFGVTGVQNLYGGGRGRAFFIEGLLTGTSPAGCVEAELTLLNYADGIGRIFIDTTGIAWPNTVFKGEYQRQGNGQFLLNCSYGGWVLPYQCVLHGLT